MKRTETKSFDEFYKMIERLHQIKDIELLISYIDPRDNDLLPINNDDNYVRALSTARPLLRLIIQRKGMNEIDSPMATTTTKTKILIKM